MDRKSGDPAVAFQADRQGEEVELYAFPAGFFHFGSQGRHEFCGAAVQDLHFLRPGAPGRTGRVHRSVAAADHGHALTHCRRRPRVGGLQESNAVQHPVQIFAGDLEAEALMRTQGQKDRGKISAQVLQIDVPAQAFAEAHLRAQFFYEAYFPLQNLPGQTVRRDVKAQGPAQERFGLKERDRVAVAAQFIRGHEPGRAAPDDGHPRGARRPRRDVEDSFGIKVRQVAFQGSDGNGLIQRVAGAGGLAGVGADAPQDTGKGTALKDHAQRRGRVALLHKAELFPDLDIQGTGGLAGRQFFADAFGQNLVRPVDGRLHRAWVVNLRIFKSPFSCKGRLKGAHEQLNINLPRILEPDKFPGALGPGAGGAEAPQDLFAHHRVALGADVGQVAGRRQGGPASGAGVHRQFI